MRTVQFERLPDAGIRSDLARIGCGREEKRWTRGGSLRKARIVPDAISSFPLIWVTERESSVFLTNATGSPLKPALECLNRGRGRRNATNPVANEDRASSASPG